MWCAISKLFSKTNCNQKPDPLADEYNMERTEDRNRVVGQELDVDSYDTRQAKQRASVKWLLSKAYNNKVPDNLKEPFYRDHEDQEHLKPQIVHTLANAELYCLGLANIYSDPNYHNLNHWGIIQALVRKGVMVVEPPDAQLTETVLIQTTPIKLSAHMAVIDAMMVLYAKEVVTPDRVVAAIQRFNSDLPVPDKLPADHEDALLLWLNSACAALRHGIEQDMEQTEGDKKPSPSISAVQDLRKLSDGVCLAALISFYCPEELLWSDIVISVSRTSQAVQNLVLVSEFCSRCLQASVFHMMPEDISYLHGSMKQNLVVFLADLFNVLEIHPVKCVRYPGTERASYLREVSKSAPSIQTSLPLKKSHSLQQADSLNRSGTDTTDRDDRHNASEEQFVVHRGRGVPTLSSVASPGDDPMQLARLRQSKERQNVDSKEEKGQSVAAGRPSNWEDQRRSSYAGRRSRRNSMSDDSQLTLENFGGSQENLHFLGRNPDKEPAVHVAQRIPQENSVPVRTNAQEIRGSGVELIFNDNGYSKEKQNNEKLEQPATVSLKDMLIHSREDAGDAVNFTELSRVRSAGDLSSKGVHIVYMQQDRELDSGSPTKTSILNKKGITANGTSEKKTSFAALPNNTTTWQQQSSSQLHQPEVSSGDDGGASSQVMASQLHNIRMKLEEKRRRIESEKRRMEVVMSKQRQKVGKAAFLQAVTKGKGSFAKSPESDSSKDSNGDVPDSVAKPQRPLSLQEISEDVSTVEHKWLDSGVPFIEERKTPDIENMNLEQYQQSIAQMNSSLHDIQSDIQRLTSQQHQIQDINYYSQQQQQQQQQQHMLQQLAAQQHLHNFAFQQQQQQQGLPHMDSPQQFYLHDQQSHRRTWSQQVPPPPLDLYQPHDSRAMWGDTSRHQTMSPKPQFASYNCQPQGGFVLHENKLLDDYVGGGGDMRYQNGDQSHHRSLGVNHVNYTMSQPQHTSFQLHADHSPRPLATPPSASPQHRSSIQRISQLMAEPGQGDSRTEKSRSPPVVHAPIPTPSVDDMEPQSISFIGMPDDPNTISQGIKGLHISSGSRTYRIPSPTRPAITRNSFQQHDLPEVTSYADQSGDDAAEKGFYISFDNDSPPKRPKPPLRMKRSSPKKERALSQYDMSGTFEREEFRPHLPVRLEPPPPREPAEVKETKKLEGEAPPGGVGLVIGSELLNPDPNAVDEMERKKERIMLLSLQRRQQQEEQKQMKEQEAQRRREMEKLKQEERERKKEEERLRRNAILEQYKLKKAMEEAEREGKLLPDKSDHLGAKPVPKMRSKTSTTSRPRPKTIHVDSGSVEMTDDILSPSRSKKGSTSNLTDRDFSSPLRRDFYRGSQDSLADRMDERRGLGASLFRGSPDDGRGASPCRSVNQLGRRGSYKTSRDTSEPGRIRGRPKYPTYQGNFRGRKSNSLMNLSGSSTDQDSMAYRYTDTDSGLGRATPPRRAPSPGMGSMRHLPSPSGPGSLPPGLMTKRRAFDDGSSDISSTPSSMLEYTGPRLYKQPATKSNRGIMLNAVEYCVFPGVVNKEAKQRVREEIARSESKHFLILFRDTGFQFRALYSYCPEREEVIKLFGTGPKQVNDRMFDKFFKYNSGGKCFSQVHTKHLTVTIDAFTIHNSLWQGKKVSLPNKKDMVLVI